MRLLCFSVGAAGLASLFLIQSDLRALDGNLQQIQAVSIAQETMEKILHPEAGAGLPAQPYPGIHSERGYRITVHIHPAGKRLQAVRVTVDYASHGQVQLESLMPR